MAAAIAWLSACDGAASRVSGFYLLGPGVLSWFALFLGGAHPGLALVPIVPFFPHARHDRGLFVDAPPRAHDTTTNFERWWQVPVQGVLLLFVWSTPVCAPRSGKRHVAMVAAAFGRPPASSRQPAWVSPQGCTSRTG